MTNKVKNVTFSLPVELIDKLKEFSEKNYIPSVSSAVREALQLYTKTIEKENYGHSTPVIGINIALTSNIKTLFLFHHDPESNDTQILEAYNQAVKYLESEQKHFPDNHLKLMIAYDSLVFDV